VKAPASRLPAWWPSAAALALVLLAWEIGVGRGVVAPLFFPPPSKIVSTIAHLLREGGLAGHTAATLSRAAAGFALGGGAGFALGLAMGLSRRVRGALDPLVAAAHPVPKVAILPLFLVIFGIGDTAAILVIALAALFPLLINTLTGVRRISPAYLDVGRACGAKPLRLFGKVVLPAALPMILGGVRLSFNMAFLVAIAVELLSARTGLGSLIWQAWQTFRTEEIYAALSVISALGAGSNAVLEVLSKRLVPWAEE
jgi:NitT/TauT family transport system permease protein